METGVHAFWLCFVPMFAALNPISIVPTFNALTEGLPPERIRNVVIQSLATATAVAFAFLIAGRALFRMLGVTVADFMVAGGALLFVISLRDLVGRESRRASGSDESVGAVPIGVPLVVGPATLTTSILLLDQHGAVPTVASMLVNLGLVALTLFNASRIHRVVGRSGSKALAKISHLLLAAIAVMIIRRGLVQIIAPAAP
ncbi:MAG: MarC family protein [Lentisphaerae bacterium]|nr:MarC family protein [Lentisphaerota bacterium]